MPSQQKGTEIQRMPAQVFPDGGQVIMVKDKDMLVVPLLVAAVAQGQDLLEVPSKMRATLEQVQRKASKEFNFSVQLPIEGSVVDLQIRVLAAAGAEASAIKEYIALHSSQAPAPFVILHGNLDMGVAYDASTPEASGGVTPFDRLLKKIKTHAVKMIREALSDARCNITSACLNGQHGAMAAAQHLTHLVDEKMLQLDSALAAPESPPYPHRMILVPTKKARTPRGGDDKSVLSISGAAHVGGGGCTSAMRPLPYMPFPGLLPSPLQAHMNGACGWRTNHSISGEFEGPENSQPSTPGGHADDDVADAAGGGYSNTPTTPRLSAYFPVNLFVTAIADGQITSDTPPKVSQRLAF
jgi:hypothetical protein